MDTLTSDVRNEAERGVIVKILVDWNLEWLPFHELRMQMMSRLGYRLDDNQLRFQLNYLRNGGYAESKQLRSGRADLEMTVVRGTSRAVDLVEGRATDAGIGL